MVDIARGNTTLRMGVPLALLGTLTGIAIADAQPDQLTARAAASGGGGGAGKLLLTDFKRGQLEKRFFTHAQADKRFLKISTANDKWLKIDAANAKFLKIDDAAIKYLKIDDANNKFLKIDDAAVKYLKIDGAAADSNKLGGLTSSQFVQGHAAVLVGTATGQGGGLFLTIPGVATFEGVAIPPGGGQPGVKITNISSSDLNLTGHLNDGILIGLLKPGESKTLNFTFNRPGQQQLAPGEADGSVQLLLPAIQKLATVNLSASFTDGTGATISWAGQAVAGQ